MTNIRYKSLSDPHDVRRYFLKVTDVVGALIKVNSQDIQQTALEQLEHEIRHEYLKKLYNTIYALSMKHGFAAFIDESLPYTLSIDSNCSGLPTYLEIIHLENDQQETQPHIAEDFRKEMLDHILTRHEIPRKLQFQQAMLKYHQIIREEQLFLSVGQPVLKRLDVKKPDRIVFLIHWAVWDREKNEPCIYLMILDDSSKIPLDQNTEQWKEFVTCCLEHSRRSMQLLSIGSEIDERFPTLHPKLLKRVTLGPIYCSEFTKVDEHIEEVLEPFHENRNEVWLFGYSVETLKSKGEKAKRQGVFGQRILEVFDIDLRNHQAVDTGATDMIKRLVMPYDVFQVLQDCKSELLGTPKYVVAPDGFIAFHI